METLEDKVRAWAYAFGVHIAVIASMFIGLWITEIHRPPVAPPGPVIEADLVGMTAAPKPTRASRPKPTPPKPPDNVEPPKPQEPKPQPPTQPNQDQIERQKVAEMAQEKAEEKAEEKRAQDEKHRQEQILLQQQQEREALKRQQELEKLKKEVAEAKHKKELEKMKLEQLEDLQKHPPVKTVANAPEAPKAVTGMNGQDNSLTAQYYAAIQKAVNDNWERPDTAEHGLRCMLHIAQIPGGEVIGVELLNPCNADFVTRNSLEQAVKRAAPLPYKGYESVFTRDFNLNFIY